MKFLKQGLSLALLGAGLAAIPGIQAAQATAPAPSSLIEQMRSEAGGNVTVQSLAATGKVGFIRSNGNDLMPSERGDSATAAAAKATDYLQKYAPAFGATPAQLQQSSVTGDSYGWTVDFTQRYQGVEVFGSKIRANLSKDGDLTAVNGYAAPDLDLSVEPRLSASAAAAKAVAFVKVKAPEASTGEAADTTGVAATSNKLMVYRLGSTRGELGKAVLAYVIEVGNGRNIRDMVFIDADTGKPVNRYSMLDNALDRKVYEASPATTPIWSEGDAFPGTLNVDQRNLVEGTGDSYNFFKATFGRDSYNALGATMKTVNNDPTIDCPNANWNGVTTNYCNGVTSDDTVSHEWAHAYTEYTSGLIYQWQSGAMNEAFSDIWGETVDQVNARFNETPDGPRTEGHCSAFSGVTPLVTINSPVSIAKTCVTGGFFGAGIPTPITGNVIAPTDPVEAGGTATNGCSPYDAGQVVTGKIVIVDRGLCTFLLKAQTAKAAGAAAVVIANNVAGTPPSFADGDTSLPPTVSIQQDDGQSIRTTLTGGSAVNITIKDDSGVTDNSYRWLSGEGDPAFGGAIRDLWNPTCYGDPGKVSDVEYSCSTADSGGVHTNSGVVNHTYALLVDGSTYNGVTVPGLGLDKAGNIFWYTQTHFLTPTSGFPELAQGLAASCTALVGQPINKMTIGATTPATPITAADCASITAVSNAVQLNQAPVQCNFQPLLTPGAAPSACGAGFDTVVAYSEDFEDGLAGWTASQEVVYPGGVNFPWQAKPVAPAGHATAVAFGQDPDDGQCNEAAGDASSRDSITSPTVTYPSGASPRMSFEHYVATETGYDGGNIKVSVNGGAFTTIPASAYTFNAPTEFEAAPGNTNPLAGQAAFTGTDGGSAFGSWGTSQVDLTKIAAVPGASLQFRIDMGRDGCGGNDGWYIDNIKIVSCIVPTVPAPPAATTVTATASPTTVAYGTARTVSVKVAGGTAAPSGSVSVSEGSASLGTAPLVAGSAQVTIPATLAVGVHTLTVSYPGDATHLASTASTTITVTKAASAAVAKAPKKVKVGKPFTVRTTVSATGLSPSGTVVIKVGGKKVGTGTLVNGKVKIKITKRFNAGKKKFTAVFAGSDVLLASSDTFKVTFMKKK